MARPNPEHQEQSHKAAHQVQVRRMLPRQLKRRNLRQWQRRPSQPLQPPKSQRPRLLRKPRQSPGPKRRQNQRLLQPEKHQRQKRSLSGFYRLGDVFKKPPMAESRFLQDPCLWKRYILFCQLAFCARQLPTKPGSVNTRQYASAHQGRQVRALLFIHRVKKSPEIGKVISAFSE